jgi:hypothetical protein
VAVPGVPVPGRASRGPFDVPGPRGAHVRWVNHAPPRGDRSTTIAAYRGLADDPARTTELDQALEDLVERFRTPDGGVEWEYLVVVATKG